MDTQRRLRGHAFLPPRKVLDKAPGAYATENIAAEDKTIIAHYFSGGADYYIAEMWQEPGEEGEPSRWMAFGYARLASHPEGQEWGYLDLDELEQVRGRTPQGLPVIVERDMHWDPTPFSQITGVEHPAEAARPAAGYRQRGQPGNAPWHRCRTRRGARRPPGRGARRQGTADAMPGMRRARRQPPGHGPRAVGSARTGPPGVVAHRRISPLPCHRGERQLRARPAQRSPCCAGPAARARGPAGGPRAPRPDPTADYEPEAG